MEEEFETGRGVLGAACGCEWINNSETEVNKGINSCKSLRQTHTLAPDNCVQCWFNLRSFWTQRDSPPAKCRRGKRRREPRVNGGRFKPYIFPLVTQNTRALAKSHRQYQEQSIMCSAGKSLVSVPMLEDFQIEVTD